MYSPRVVNRVCGQTWQGITLQQGWGPSDSSPRDPDSGQSFFFFFFFYFIIPLTLKSTNRKKEKSVKNNHCNTASKIKCNPAFSLQILSQNFDLGACQIFFFFFFAVSVKRIRITELLNIKEEKIAFALNISGCSHSFFTVDIIGFSLVFSFTVEFYGFALDIILLLFLFHCTHFGVRPG